MVASGISSSSAAAQRKACNDARRTAAVALPDLQAAADLGALLQPSRRWRGAGGRNDLSGVVARCRRNWRTRLRHRAVVLRLVARPALAAWLDARLLLSPAEWRSPSLLGCRDGLRSAHDLRVGMGGRGGELRAHGPRLCCRRGDAGLRRWRVNRSAHRLAVPLALVPPSTVPTTGGRSASQRWRSFFSVSGSRRR